MVSFFNDPRTLTYNIIAIQESWWNLEFFTTYHSHKNIFYLIYMEYVSTRVCLYINKKLSILSWNAIYHSPDLCIIDLDIPNISKLYIHNIYNPIPMVNSYLKQVPKLKQAMVLFQSNKHIILGNFNLHYPVWGGIEAKNDSNVQNLLAMVKQHGLHLLLKPYWCSKPVGHNIIRYIVIIIADVIKLV